MNTETFFVTGSNAYTILEVLLDNEFLWDKPQYKCYYGYFNYINGKTNKVIAFDNRTGQCNTEFFKTVEQAKEWLGYEDK